MLQAAVEKCGKSCKNDLMPVCTVTIRVILRSSNVTKECAGVRKKSAAALYPECFQRIWPPNYLVVSFIYNINNNNFVFD